MKYLKFYEHFESNIDDIMIEYVENKYCHNRGNDTHFKAYDFDENVESMNDCIRRLNNMGIEYFTFESYICFISDELTKFVSNIFNNLRKQLVANKSEKIESLYYHREDLIFFISVATPKKGILINMNFWDVALSGYKFRRNDISKNIFLMEYLVEKYISKYIPNYKEMSTRQSFNGL